MPVPQPLALIEPAVTGVQVLSTMVSVGAVGGVHTPGAVTTAVDAGLTTVLSESQLQRV